MKNRDRRPHSTRKGRSARRWTRAPPPRAGRGRLGRRPAAFSLLFVALAVAAGVAGSASSRGGTRAKRPAPPQAAPATQSQSGEQISPSAQQQIAALMAEKRSRTSAQKKMDSRLIYGAKMARGEQIAEGVETLQVNLPKAADGRTIVDITANVDGAFLAQLERLGATIIISHPQYRSVRAEVDLASVESIAALSKVINIRPMDEAIFWRQDGELTDGAPSVNPERLSPFRPGLEPRLESVRRKLTAAFDDFETNAYGVNANGVRKNEADTTHRANVARNTYGFDGTGVKIGVLSDGVRALAMSQAAGDLPHNVTVVPGQDGPTGNLCPITLVCNEGTAMLELIHDIAPGAQLFFATAQGGPSNFANNILTLRNTYHCDIIVDDVFYFAESPFHDGQAAGVVSPNNQGLVTQAVNDVTADGALYFSSAGNSGNKNDNTSGLWEGDFVDGGDAPSPIGAANGRIHQFPADGATPAQTFDTLVAGVTSGPFTLNWADPLGASNNDYDLYILTANGAAVAASSTNGQDGNDDPIEFINASANTALRMVIVKFNGDPRFLHLSTSRGRMVVNTPGATSGHSTAANAFGVGATPASDLAGGPYPNPHSSTNQVETFSSDGPRKLFFKADNTPYTPGNFSSTGGITRQKPDITAADNASVTGAGGFPIIFGGTSAAAPDAAAITALLKSANPTLTLAQARTALNASAIDIEAPGVDRDSGVGIIMADTALASLGLPASAANVTTGTVVADAVGGNANGFIEPGERGTLAVQLVNTGNAAATSVTATLSTSTPNVFITPPASRSYPDIAATNGTSSSATPFEFVLGAGATYGTNINFVVTVTYNGGTTRAFPIIVPTGRLANISTTLDTTAPTAPPEATSAATGTQTGRANFTFPTGNCGAAKANPGTTSTLARRYDSYTFTNTSASTICVTVQFSFSNTALLHAVAYVPSFTPATPTVNYVADSGGSTTQGAGTAQLFSFNVAAGATFVVVVSESNQNGGLGVPYNLRVSGLPAQAVPANAAPVITAPGAQTTPEDTPLVFSGGNAISVADSDAGNNALKVTLTATNGTLTLSGTTGLSFTTGDGTNDPTMVFTGSASDINAALSGMSFTPTLNYSGSASVQIDVDDQGFTGTGGAQTDSETVPINVTPVNDLSISDVTQAEGNAGTTAFTFNVTLEAPAGPGGVTFTASTADGTASSASDYTALTNQPGSIAEGQSSTTVTVNVNGDMTQEPNETFTVNISNITNAQAGDAQGLGTILNDDGAPNAGQVVISEFRLRGPDPDGNGALTGTDDEFIELYNTTNSDFVVADRAPVALNTAGWAIVSSDAPLTPKYIIPAGTTIPARGHFLVTNGTGYSLGAYATADAPGGSPATYNVDIPDGAGLALFRTGTPLPTSEASGDILDRAGFRVSGAPYTEGLGLTPQGGVTIPAQHSFVRKMPTGPSQDTGDNEADFDFVSTDAGVYGGRQSILGAPGPENTSSPVERNSQFGGFLLDSMQSANAPPNRVRSFTSDPSNNSTFGTLTIRRRITNNTGVTVTRLRFRVSIITGYPVTDPSLADMRVRTAPDESVSDVGDTTTCGLASAPCTVQVIGTVLEAPSATSNGGLNSSLSVTLAPAVEEAVAAPVASPAPSPKKFGKRKVDTPVQTDFVPLAAPLDNGQSINVQFLLGIEKTGRYRFYVIIEALP